jgi:hypothetical protein
LFHDEGAGGVYLNDLTPAVARSIAAAFGAAEKWRVESGEGRERSPGASPLRSELRKSGEWRVERGESKGEKGERRGERE